MSAELIRVEWVWSPAAGDVRQGWLQLPAGSTLGQALAAVPELDPLRPATLVVGVWGKLAVPSQVLRDGDRVEVYRPLTVDPKEARRLRYRKRGQRIVSRHRPLAGKTTR